MALLYFIKAATSEYTDKDGTSKKRYSTIGTVFESKHGKMLSIESLPLMSLKEGKLMAFLNEPEEKSAKQADPFNDAPF